MDEGKVLLVNLAKGRLGEDSSSLLGGLLVTTIGLAAFSRADVPPEKPRDFYVYVDEFQSFTTLALVNMFSELRKYRVGFTVAHQYLHQLEPEIRHAVFGNAGTIISFRVGAEDAPYIVQEFHERFEQIDFLQLPNFRIYIKVMIDGMPSKPFSAITLAPTSLHTRGSRPDYAPHGAFFARLAGGRAPSIRPSGSVWCHLLCNAFGVDLPWSAARRGSLPRGSRAGRHEAERDGAEQRALRATRRQLDADARDVLDHTRADLNQALPDRRERLTEGSSAHSRDGIVRPNLRTLKLCGYGP